MHFWATYKKIGLTAVIFIISFLAGNAQVGDSLTMAKYNQLALYQINLAKYDEAIKYCDSALAISENATSYYYLAYTNNIKNKWDEAIKYGIRSAKLNPGFMRIYAELFNAYYGAHRWKDAVDISEKAQQADSSNYMNDRINNAYTSLKTEKKTSRVILLIFFLILSGFVIIPFIQIPQSKFKYSLAPDSKPRLSTVILLSACTSCIFYLLFLALSKWIWSLNPQSSASEFTPFVRAYIFERDGAESFVLYILMFLNVILSVAFTGWLLRAGPSKNQYLAGGVVLLCLAGYYFYNIKFILPVADIGNGFLVAFVLFLLCTALYFLYQKMRIITIVLLIIIVAFTTLVVAFPPSLPDLSYIVAPALRMKHGAKISEIYFQYDILLSLFALLWLKLSLSLDWFPFLGQLSFFVFFIGCFLFSERLFKSKGLSVLFLLALLMIRYYAALESGVTIFQVSPLRLDLWFILLVVSYKKGFNHWIFGVCLGLLAILHRNLGLIYLGSYFALIVFLFLADTLPLIREKSLKLKSLLPSFFKYLKPHTANLAIIAISFLLCYILTGEIFSSSALTYRKYGIGMLPISGNSFYWYVPIMLSTLAIFLFYHRKKLADKYFSTGLFIILLAISNSMYFFGRSHENNILNISAILLFALFVLFDILIFTSAEQVHKPQQKSKKQTVEKKYSFSKKWSLSLPFLVIILSGYFYSNRVSDKLNRKFVNFEEKQFAYSLQTTPLDTTAIKSITANSNKIYFLDFQTDFYNYYYGGYIPSGYFSPCNAWVFKKDLIKYLQSLLDNNYFVVVNADKLNYFKEYLPYLDYNSSKRRNSFISIHKEPTALLLPKDNIGSFHIAFNDTLSANGIDRGGVAIKNDMTIEVIVKPHVQSTGETIINNFYKTDAVKGFTLQVNNPAIHEYMFAFGNMSATSPTITFQLESNRWHYVTITIDKEYVKAYDNGNILTNFKFEGKPLLNSDAPITIGNRLARDARFNGFIREVKISDGILSEAEIVKRGAEISTMLNQVH